MRRKKEDLLPIVVQKLAVQGTMLNTAISSLADLLCVATSLIPKCSSEDCDGLAVGTVDSHERCYRCCLESSARGQEVRWKQSYDSILRIEESVDSLRKNGYGAPEDLN